MNKILITGASGQLGKSLKNHLSSKFESYFFSRAELDINDLETLSKRLQLINPDIIINCAAYTAVDRAEEEADLADQINHLAVKQLAKIANQEYNKMFDVSRYNYNIIDTEGKWKNLCNNQSF